MSTRKQTPYSEIADVLANLPVLVRGARRSRGLSLRGAAIQIGCGFNTLKRMEDGEDYVMSNALAVVRWLDGAA